MTILKEDLPVFAGSGEFLSGGPIPLEDPNLPRLAGFFQTLKMVLWRPGEFFRRLRRDGWAEALAFGLMVGTIGFLSFLYWKLLIGVGVSQQLAEVPGAAQILNLGVGVMVGLMLLAPVIVMADLGLGALGLWVGAALMNGGAASFPAAMRVIGYAQAGLVAALIPFLGGPLAILWVLGLTYWGAKTVFGLSWGRALGALAISLALQALCLLLVLGGLLGLMGLMGVWLLWG